MACGPVLLETRLTGNLVAFSIHVPLFLRYLAKKKRDGSSIITIHPNYYFYKKVGRKVVSLISPFVFLPSISNKQVNIFPRAFSFLRKLSCSPPTGQPKVRNERYERKYMGTTYLDRMLYTEIINRLGLYQRACMLINK